MIAEKRQYDRIPLGNRCIVYCGFDEAVGKVVDISEGGVGLLLSGKIEADDMALTFIEEDPKYLSNSNVFVFSCKGHVVRHSDNMYGCTIALNDDIKNYIATKKASQFRAYK